MVTYIALAATLIVFALVALTVGLVIGLTPWLGALGATAAVTLGLLGVAAICGWVGKSRWAAMARHLTGTSDRPKDGGT